MYFIIGLGHFYYKLCSLHYINIPLTNQLALYTSIGLCLFVNREYILLYMLYFITNQFYIFEQGRFYGLVLANHTTLSL